MTHDGGVNDEEPDRYVADAADAAGVADVIVVGAGQAGLATAGELVRRGLVPGSELLVLDAEQGPGLTGSPIFPGSPPGTWTRRPPATSSSPGTTVATRRHWGSRCCARCASPR